MLFKSVKSPIFHIHGNNIIPRIGVNLKNRLPYFDLSMWKRNACQNYHLKFHWLIVIWTPTGCREILYNRNYSTWVISQNLLVYISYDRFYYIQCSKNLKWSWLILKTLLHCLYHAFTDYSSIFHFILVNIAKIQ